ncbi:MaoC family dehydratase N-terminal domain-containing protein [Sulfitobacter sp. F26169L]|uniref:MaoC family dehydratase n=1 Tax=Sulfitobacter sp. F26169L TaxID=2996015 RepID=UPI002260AE5A|nr:MaoC family dehydratase N-terminal domain-containing protein [Sulfitobacter sp. F26169L]MCX7568091.1 MaoC family dehydratase N-terminal domain-containing protein [Sulfitobacter sp. F26169L]
MKLLGEGFYWNDLSVGDRFKTYGRTISETDIINFVSAVGMLESLFVDAEFRARHSAIDGRPAPAALVYSIAEGLTLNATGQGTGLAFLQMELNVEGPVLQGDTIHVEIEVTEVRATSKMGRGLVRTRNSIVNQRGETVITYTPLRLMAGRD